MSRREQVSKPDHSGAGPWQLSSGTGSPSQALAPSDCLSPFRNKRCTVCVPNVRSASRIFINGQG